jgi:chemotaxis signal transduction protein
MTADPFILVEAIAQKERELNALRSELASQRASSRLPAAEAVILCCRLGAHRVALLASEIREVVQMAELRSLPDVPAWFMGLLALGNERLPVLDLSARETGARRIPDPSELIVLTDTRTGACGLVVDAIDELVTVQASQIRRAPPDAPFGAHVLGLVELETDTVVLLSAAPLSLDELSSEQASEGAT